MHEGWMFGMGWFWILALVFVGVVIWFALRPGTGNGSRSGPPPAEKSPEDVLKDRFAKGEIDEKEYRARIDALRD